MDISQRLRAEGYKVTPQRVAIYKALQNQHGEHPSAEILYNQLHDEHPTISLATVYKTLEIFAKIGLVKIINVGGDYSLYDTVVEPHPHIRCIECGMVEDIEGINVSEIQEKVHKITSYQVYRSQLVFDGRCEKCIEKGQE